MIGRPKKKTERGREGDKETQREGDTPDGHKRERERERGGGGAGEDGVKKRAGREMWIKTANIDTVQLQESFVNLKYHYL